MFQLIASYTTEENVSYALYDTGEGNAAYVVRDEDAGQLVGRVDGPAEIIKTRWDTDVRKLR